MSQFKEGDIALVVGGDAFLGSQVEIFRWVNPGEDFETDRAAYHYRNGRPGWVVVCGSRCAVKHESHLMPLRGDFQPEQQKVLEVVE